MNKLLREAINNRSPPLTDLMIRQFCQVKTFGIKSIPCTIKDAERRFTEDFPNWDMELIKFPPGELYYDQMKPCTRAKDLEEKYGNKLAKDYLCHT